MEEIKIGSYVRVELGARSFTGIVRSVGGDGVTIWNDATGRVRIARRSRVKVLSFPSKPAPDDRPSRLTGWDLLVLGAGTTFIEELRKASSGPDNWKLADEHMPLTARNVMDRDDRWCVLVDASKVSEKDLIFDPSVVGFVYLSANKGEKT